MSKEKIRKNEKHVGVAPLGDPHFEGITKKQNNKGITLIALIITIIIMLILVAVSVSVALNGGLFKTAKNAANETKTERDEELTLSEGQIEVNGKIYLSYEHYLDNYPLPELPEDWEIIDTPSTWIKSDGIVNNKVTAIREISTGKVVPLPKGFEVSTVETENSTEEGLVITDGTNEFVWIEYTSEYTEGSVGPLTATGNVSRCIIDSQENLNYYYGKNEDGTPFYNYLDFTYEADKTRIVESVNKYDGFYVGRYETTIDNGVIGVQKGKEILTTSKSIPQTNNNPCRWWGLYKVQKDMYEENESVFSSMITNSQWGIIMSYTGYGKVSRAADTYTTKPDLSAAAYATDNTQYDVSKNIYDLAGNVWEFNLGAYDNVRRFRRGGSCDDSYTSNGSTGWEPNQTPYGRIKNYSLYKISRC